MTGLDLPGIKPPAPTAASPFPRRRGSAACTLPWERLHAHSCGVACGLLGRESEEPREQAADPTSGSRGSRLLQVLNPCRPASAKCPPPQSQRSPSEDLFPSPGSVDQGARRGSEGGWGRAPNSLAVELVVGAVTWGGGQRRGSGRRGLAGSAGPAAFIKTSLPEPPSSLPLSPPPSGIGRGWGGTLATGRVERAVRSPVTSLALSRQVGDPNGARGREVQKSVRPAPAAPALLGPWFSPPAHLFLCYPRQVPSLGCLSLNVLIQ